MRPLRDVHLALGAALLAALHVARAWPTVATVVDDAYISGRYAMHLALGNGLVYNVGEPPVEGYTNLLWVLWTAAAWALTGADPVQMHPILVYGGLLHGVLGVFAVTALARALAGRPHATAWVPGLWLALDPHYAVVATNGIESAQFLAFVSGAVALTLFATEGRAPVRVAAALAIGGLIAVRPEGIAVAGALVGYDLLIRRARWREALSWAPLAGAIAAAGPVWIGRWLYFGDFLTNTWRAKDHKALADQLWFNVKYLGPDAPFWLLVGAGFLGSAWRPWSAARAIVWAVAAGLVVIAFRVDMWMPGGRLLLPAVALIFALTADRLRLALESEGGVAARAPWLAPIAVLGVAIPLLIGPVPRHVYDYESRHTALPGNGAELAARHIAAHAPDGAVVMMRDAGVQAFYVGPRVRVFETHQRALTRSHPGGRDTDLAAAPANPEFIITTLQRETARSSSYPNDKRVTQRSRDAYVYLGRVYQHFHRYYDVYARADLDVPPLDAEAVHSFAGAPLNAPKR